MFLGPWTTTHLHMELGTTKHLLGSARVIAALMSNHTGPARRTAVEQNIELMKSPRRMPRSEQECVSCRSHPWLKTSALNKSVTSWGTFTLAATNAAIDNKYMRSTYCDIQKNLGGERTSDICTDKLLQNKYLCKYNVGRHFWIL